MRFNDDDPDVARYVELIEVRALERLARRLRSASQRAGVDSARDTQPHWFKSAVHLASRFCGEQE